MFYTEDGGKNWVNITDNAVKNKTVGWWPDYYFSAHTSDIHFVGDKGVWLSDWYGVWQTEDITGDKSIWTNKIKGIENTVTFDLTCPTRGASLIVGVADNCGMRVENTDVYPTEKLNTPLRNITSGIDFCENNPDIVARIATDTNGNGAVGISTDNGRTYTESKPCNFGGGKIAVSAAENGEGKISIVFVPVNDLPYYSDDMGKTWTKAVFPDGTATNFIDKIWRWNTVLQSDRVISDMFYLMNPQNGNFYVSSDGGRTWELRYKRGNGKSAASIKSAPYKESTVYMSLANEGLKKSTDAGRTFSTVPNVQYSHLIAFGKGIDSTTPAMYLYGRVNNEEGIFRSVDMGESWVKISNNQTAVGGDPNCMNGDRQTFGTVYIGTNGRGYYVGTDKLETVLHVWYDDSYCGNHQDNKTGRLINQISNDYNGAEIPNEDSKETDIVYNGTNSLKIFDSKGWIKYNEWSSMITDITKPSKAEDSEKNIKDEVKAGRAYICGWFYTDVEGVRLSLDAQKANNKITHNLPKDEWVFISEKVTETTKNGDWEIPYTGGSLYIDDLKLVSVSDKSSPTPSERTIAIPSQPDMYTKNLYTFYSDGELNSSHQHNRPDVTRFIDYENTERIPYAGTKAIKMTGELYLQPKKEGNVVTYGELSDEIKTAIEEGRAYITFWQYINAENLAETDEGYNKDVEWDLYFPENIRTRGEWVWVKSPLTDATKNQLYFKCKNAYAWISDICITVFEDREERFFEDKYELTIGNSIVSEEQSEVSSEQTIGVSGEYFNNTRKLETILPMAVVYGAGGKLESFNQGELVSIVPFRGGTVNYDFKVPAESGGKKIKLMLWSDLDGIKPVRDATVFEVVN